jgi:S-adenosylhomocysteine hydrolase
MSRKLKINVTATGSKRLYPKKVAVIAIKDSLLIVYIGNYQFEVGGPSLRHVFAPCSAVRATLTGNELLGQTK